MAEQLKTHPLISEPTAAELTPLNIEGRFSLSEVTIDDKGGSFYIPCDQWGRQLSPMETDTDVPLPIIPYEQRSTKPNKHHGYYFERHYLRGPEAIKVLRYSRLQRVNPSAHQIYHNNYFGTLMPTHKADAAKGVILNSAGYIPQAGVVIHKEEINVRELTDQERNRLRRPNTLLSEQTRRIGDFLMEYALEQRLDHVKQSQIEEFLSLTPRKIARNEQLRARKLQLGLRLTNIAISVAVDPVESEYQNARHNLSLRSGMPSTAWRLAKKLVRGREKKYLDALEDRLIDDFGVVGIT